MSAEAVFLTAACCLQAVDPPCNADWAKPFLRCLKTGTAEWAASGTCWALRYATPTGLTPSGPMYVSGLVSIPSPRHNVAFQLWFPFNFKERVQFLFSIDCGPMYVKTIRAHQTGATCLAVVVPSCDCERLLWQF